MTVTDDQMRRAVATTSRVSDQIRALDRLGVARADIARFLNRRYQQVRNVLEADKLRSAHPSASSQSVSQSVHALRPDGGRPARPASLASSPVQGAVRLRIEAESGLALPSHLLDALGVGPGAEVLAVIQDGQVTLLGPAATAGRAEELVRQLVDRRRG